MGTCLKIICVISKTYDKNPLKMNMFHPELDYHSQQEVHNIVLPYYYSQCRHK